MDGVKWPTIPGLKYPEYSTNTGISSYGEQLPPLDKMPGHVLYGWTDRKMKDDGKEHQNRRLHSSETRAGHKWNTIREQASAFPKSWSDQKIVDSVCETIENPDLIHTTVSPKHGGKTIRTIKTVDGVTIFAHWIVDPQGRVKSPEAYPIHGDGVTMVKDGEHMPVPEYKQFTDKSAYLTIEEYNERRNPKN